MSSKMVIYNFRKWWLLNDVAHPASNPMGTGVIFPGGKAVWTLWNREKSLAPAGSQTAAFEPVARHYTDWAIPVPPQ
jgi:hypothetical protein